MGFLKANLNETDVQISQFARAMALPVRVFIIRMIIENGNGISKKAFYTDTYKSRTIDKHILELKSLGIIKTSNEQASVIYCIDKKMFDMMSVKFSLLFNHKRQ
ncbi:hypothetical protein KXD93_12900 [Mucilaginibacter sp. BJC16-A38]|uniref:hypothetical protein n=1 Tax=Mucilaginibacter phenanthrenivorans TaxID=1234842 RepID=UPI0021582761|nr:hypothetical protein [Mucilaginibacter phenanthrenivorans]MCR8558547.1 hypothetical protein [Mucilaginibacter phenanthrenivorans]